MSETPEQPTTADEHETVNRESHPNAAGPEGLAGDMGLSSERSGPFEGIEGTGSQASAASRTDGETPTTRADDTGYETADTDSDADEPEGEVRPDPVANKHEFDPARNPRH
jgi:hypothetical protein